MSLAIEVVHKSLIKKGEELCGDHVETIKNEDEVVVVLADGLGSGVKANILSTLTTSITSKMIKEKVSIHEIVRTLADTLPVCKIRDLAYSTFSILKMNIHGEVDLFEYDNPKAILLKGKENIVYEYERKIESIDGRNIAVSHFTLRPDDKLFLISDGIVHAGIGSTLNFGWERENVSQYLNDISKRDFHITKLTNELVKVCQSMYEGKPGDDTTAVGIQASSARYLNIMVGPPQDRASDQLAVDKFIHSRGKKVICGGTTSNIVSRITGNEIQTNLEYFHKDIPPSGYMKGIDLVTEGLLTLTKCVEILEKSKIKYGIDDFYEKNDAASLLVQLMMDYATNINMIIGRATNPSYKGITSSFDADRKSYIIDQLVHVLSGMGKRVHVEYY